MTTTTTPASSPPGALHPLLARMVAETCGEVFDADGFREWARQPGLAMAVFADDPARSKETLDLAVIVPELHATAGRHFRVSLLTPVASRALASTYGFARWPAFVILRDGLYVGAVDGIRDWSVYVAELGRLLTAPPTRPPTVGIPVRSAEPAAPGCA